MERKKSNDGSIFITKDVIKIVNFSLTDIMNNIDKKIQLSLVHKK